jgi:hypothetical protein
MIHKKQLRVTICLDAGTRRTLTQLVSHLGWSPSRVMREGLRLLAASHPVGDRPRIVGMGQFSSGVPDLGSSKKHLKGFGRCSRYCSIWA